MSRKRRTRKQRGGGNKSKLFKDAYAITLDRYPKRLQNMLKYAKAAGLPLQAWKGVVITPQQVDSLPPLGVGTTHFKDRTGAIFNLGVIGAFLAHRDLLRHVAQTAPTNPGTLVFEDDVTIPADFYAKLHALEAEIEAKAPDWDYLFLDKQLNTIAGKPVSEHLIKLDKDMTGYKNWGIWAYIVRNKSISSRILPTMEHMLDVPDIQLAKFGDKLNMYLVTPSIIHGDPETSVISVVTELDKQQPKKSLRL